MSEPPGADVYLDGNRLGTTPVEVRLQHKKSHTLVFKKAGYQDASCFLDSSTQGGWVIFDVLTGLVPIIIDAATGDWSQISDKHCSVNLPATAYAPGVATVPGTPAPADTAITSRPVAAQPPANDSRPAWVPAYALPPAPPEAASQELDEVSKTSRKLLVSDMKRIGLVSDVEYGPPGTLRVAIGQSFYTSESKDLYFGKLAHAYSRWKSPGTILTIELWDQGRKFGEYADEVFLFGPRYSTPRGCDTQPAVCSQAQAAPSNASLSAAAGAPSDVAAAPATPSGDEGKAGHNGFHFGLGLGAGAAGLSCDACSFDRETALSGFLSLGWTVGENTLLGIESSGWTKGEGGGAARIYSLMALLTNYLNESSGLFLSGGLGLVGYHQGTDFGTLSANGFGVSGRLGIEATIGRRIAFIPYLAYVSTIGGAKFKLEGESLGQELDINNIQFGIALGLH